MEKKVSDSGSLTVIGSGYWKHQNEGSRDKKFEGYSSFSKKSSMQKKKEKHLENLPAKHLEEDFILNLQKQIVLMEQELKLLKEREVDQKNQASGYETLLRDGIPLNEHFIALKNKFNQEKDNEEKKMRNMDEDKKAEETNNLQKQHRIEILEQEFADISAKYNDFKLKTSAHIEDLSSKIYNESHTKEVQEKEKADWGKKLGEIQNDNLDMGRKINKNQMFSQKD